MDQIYSIVWLHLRCEKLWLWRHEFRSCPYLSNQAVFPTGAIQ